MGELKFPVNLVCIDSKTLVLGKKCGDEGVSAQGEELFRIACHHLDLCTLTKDDFPVTKPCLRDFYPLKCFATLQ